MKDRERYRAWALRMARQQVEMLLDPNAAHNPKDDVHHAVVLIDDLVHQLDQPALAVEFALQFHGKVEAWGNWTGWAEALETILTHHTGDSVERIHLLINRGSAERGVRAYERAVASITQALAQARYYGDTPLTAKALHQLARISLFQDNYVQAREHLDQALQLDHSCIPPTDLGHITINLGNIAVQQARYSEAFDYFDQAEHYYHQAQNTLFLTMARANKADLLHREGKSDEAIRMLREAIQTFQVLGATYDQAVAENSLGYIYLQKNQTKESESYLKSSVRSLNAIGALSQKVYVLTNLIELYLVTDEDDLLKDLSAEAYMLADVCNRQIVRSAVHVDYGKMLYKNGHREKARQLWREALAIQESQHAEELASKTRYLLEQSS